jgi:hypothetical protein
MIEKYHPDPKFETDYYLFMNFVEQNGSKLDMQLL